MTGAPQSESKAPKWQFFAQASPYILIGITVIVYAVALGGVLRQIEVTNDVQNNTGRTLTEFMARALDRDRDMTSSIAELSKFVAIHDVKLKGQVKNTEILRELAARLARMEAQIDADRDLRDSILKELERLNRAIRERSRQSYKQEGWTWTSSFSARGQSWAA